jgi:tetratricopeptide (TPR) repeat protein
MNSEQEYLQRAVAEINNGTLTTAIQTLEQGLSENAQNASVLQLLGVLYMNTGKLAAAISTLEKAAVQDPRSAVLQCQLGSCAEALGAEGQALAYFKQAFTLQPGLIEARLAYARLCGKVGKPLDAVAAYQQLLLDSPQCEGAMQGLKQALTEIERSCEARFYNNFGPILIVGQGHSASVYVGDELRRRLRLCPRRGLLSEYKGLLFKDSVDEFAKLGGIIVDHVDPRRDNLYTLEHSGLKKLVVQLRDPRQTVYSNTLWNDHCLQRTSAPEWPKADKLILLNLMPEGYFSWDFEKKLDYMIETDLVYFVGWLKGWIEASRSAEWSFKIHFSQHRELKRDPDAFFRAITDFYNIDQQYLSGEVYQSKQATSGEPGEHAFRKGSNEEWRQKMNPRQLQRVNELMPDQLLEFFGWER